MSVAFRRESDEEHLEPRFELPIPPGRNLVTPRGLQLLHDKVAEIEARVASAVSDEALADARRTLRYWHTRLATAEASAPPEPGEVGIGSTVTFLMGGRKRTITVVGGDEADPPAGLLAFSAPLARALIGAAEGDRVDFAGGVLDIVTVEDPA